LKRFSFILVALRINWLFSSVDEQAASITVQLGQSSVTESSVTLPPDLARASHAQKHASSSLPKVRQTDAVDVGEVWRA
jgi:hypothetical protein